MTAFIFVLGIFDKTEQELRFEHKVVMAKDVDDAYAVGARAAEDAGLLPVADHETANDYVIQLVGD